MNKTFTQWNKQLDDFDGATKALPGLANDVRMWGVFAPALPALYDAVLREMDAYQVTARKRSRTPSSPSWRGGR